MEKNQKYTCSTCSWIKRLKKTAMDEGQLKVR